MCPIITTGDRRVLQAFCTQSASLGMVVCAGGIRNSFVAGAQVAFLQTAEPLQEPVAVVGVSSGFATRAYYQGGGQVDDVRVFSDDMSSDTGRLFNIARRLVGRWPFDVEYVDAVFRQGTTGRPIQAEQVLKHPTKLYGVLADPETGHGYSYLPQTAREVYEMATIATAVTGFARPLTFRGLSVTDGYASDLHLPVQELIRLHPEVTDVLVFASQDYEENPQPASQLEMLMYRIGLASASLRMEEMIQTRHVRFMAEAERIIDPAEVGGRRVCIIWLPCPYHPIYVTRAEALDLIAMGRYTMQTLLTEARVA